MRVHVITNCSSTRLIQPLARVQDLPEGLTAEDAVRKWVGILNSFPPSTTPREQYRGQGFMTLQKTLTDNDNIVAIKIVTGGLGLTDIDEPIVPYDFSGSAKEEFNITQKVTKEPFSLPAWWTLINRERTGEPHPVADYLESLSGDDVCIIACTKIFLKYIAQDFLSASPEARNKCRILLTASSIGSVPMQLRPYIVSYERASIQHIPGNRNDINHRALQHFLTKIKSLDEFGRPSYELSASVFGTSEGGVTDHLDIPATLASRPDLLKMDAETAYKVLYREVGPFGGRMNFKGFFLKAQQEAGLIQKIESDADDDAMDALSGLNFSQVKNVPEADNKAIELLSVFASAVRKVNPGAEFAAADICTWAKSYTDKKEMAMPGEYESPMKLVYFLKGFGTLVGIEPTEKNFKLVAE